MPGTPPAPTEYGVGRLFDLAPDAVIVGEATTGRVVLWNRGAEEMFGYPAEEAVGMPLAAIVADDLADALHAGIARYAAEGHTDLVDSQALVEVRGKHRDGHLVWIELRLAGLDPSGSEGRPILAIARDVSTRKWAEELAARRTEELQSAHEALRDIIAITAHDLRGPLGAITSALKMIESLPLSEEQRSDMLSVAGRQAVLMGRLLDDLVDIGLIESGKLDVRPEVFPLTRAVADALGPSEEEETVQVSVPDGLSVRADPAHVTRVLTNLLTNSRRYGGPPVEITAGLGSRRVWVRVRDHGPGIPEELVLRMFQRFEKGEGSMGTGLGLAISRGLAEANGGSLGYEDPPDGGACFALCLPPG